MTLKKRLGSSTAWMTIAASGNSIISFVIFIVLSRILNPSDIGLVAFALIVVEIGKIIVNAGFSQAVVQRPQWDNTYASTCFYLNFLFSIAIIFIVVFIATPLIVRYYEPQTEPILKVLSVIFFLEGFKAVHEGKLKREFSFRVIAFRTVFASLISGIIGIYLALKGFGVWALVWQQVISQVLITLVTLASAKWMPTLVFSINDCKKLLGFSIPLMIAQVIANIGSKIFELLIGIMIGPAALGFYRVGGRALYILQDVVLKPLESTTLSAFSRLTQPDLQALGVMRVIRMSAYLTLPIFFGAAAVGPEFIILAFGEKWQTSGEIMMILAIGVAPSVIGQQINAVLTASGNSHMVMILAAITLAGNCLLGFISVPFGLTITACAFALRSYLTIFFNLYFFKRVYGVGICKVLKIVAPSFVSATIMFIILLTIKFFFVYDLPEIVRLLLLCIVGGLVYVICIRTIFYTETKIFFHETLDLAPQKFKRFIVRAQLLLRLT